MGHMQVPRQLLAYHLELFTSVTITMYLPAKLCNLFSGIRRGHHQAVTAAIGLLFNKVDRVLLADIFSRALLKSHLPFYSLRMGQGKGSACRALHLFGPVTHPNLQC